MWAWDEIALGASWQLGVLPKEILDVRKEARAARSAQEQPRDVQKHLRNDPREFQENRKFELQGASGEPRGT